MVPYGWVLALVVASFAIGFKVAESRWRSLLKEAMAHWKETADQRDRYFWMWFHS